ncbi:MAG: flagellar filament capping protein FliD [Deltaproteobacteria bacterium]
MSNSIMNFSTYSKLFSSSFGASNTNPATNLIYGSLVASRYSQKFSTAMQSTMSTNLSSLNSSTYELKSASQNLIETNKSSAFNSRTVSSDNTAITGTAQQGAKTQTYKISVSQTAQAQVNKGSSFSSDSKTTLEEGTHSIKLSANGKESTISFNIKEGQTNKEALSSMASAINQSKAGVTAKVVTDEKTKTSYLEVTGNETGAKNSFSITDVSGNTAEAAGINKVEAASRDAIYKIDGKEFTSSSNKLSLDNGKVNLTLNKATEKEAVVTIKEDKEKIADSIEKFASSFNSVIDNLNNSDSLIGKEKALKDIKNLSSFNKSSLSEIGINTNSDGSLSVDRKKLEAAIEKEPSKVKRLFNGFDGIASKTKSLSDRLLASSSVDTAGKAFYNSNIDSFSYLKNASKSSFMRNQAAGLFVNMLL